MSSLPARSAAQDVPVKEGILWERATTGSVWIGGAS